LTPRGKPELAIIHAGEIISEAARAGEQAAQRGEAVTTLREIRDSLAPGHLRTWLSGYIATMGDDAALS
jgi:hypothetical protein